MANLGWQLLLCALVEERIVLHVVANALPMAFHDRCEDFVLNNGDINMGVWRKADFKTLISERFLMRAVAAFSFSSSWGVGAESGCVRLVSTLLNRRLGVSFATILIAVAYLFTWNEYLCMSDAEVNVYLTAPTCFLKIASSMPLPEMSRYTKTSFFWP